MCSSMVWPYMYCYERFESTLTPTMLMLVSETTPQEAGEFLAGYLNWEVIKSQVGWVLLLIMIHILWTALRCWLGDFRQKMILPKVNPAVITGFKAFFSLVVAYLLCVCVSQTWDNKVAMHRMLPGSFMTLSHRRGTIKWQCTVCSAMIPSDRWSTS